MKNDDSFDRRSVMLMLGSVVLLAANTLLIRAVALHTPAAGGRWLGRHHFPRRGRVVSRVRTSWPGPWA